MLFPSGKPKGESVEGQTTVLTNNLICPKSFLPVLFLQINHRFHKAILDTGSHISVIPFHKLNDFQKEEIKEWDLGPIRTVQSSNFLPQGKINLRFQIQNRVFHNDFAVVKNYDVMILGIDVISKAGIIPDLKNKTFGFSDMNKKPFKLFQNKGEPLSSNSLRAMTDNEESQLNELLAQFPDVITDKVGKTNVFVHKIELQKEFQKKHKPYPSSPKVQQEIDSQLKFMLDNDIIRPSHSEYGSPVFLRPKPNGEWRFIVDYRDINAQTLPDRYPGVRIPDMFKKICNAKYLSICDATKGYWQVEMDEESKKYTAFVTKNGLFEFNRMPFGIKNCPATFQRLMDKVLSGLDNVNGYQDDILIASQTFNEHLNDIKETLLRLRNAGITLNPKKCSFGQKQIKCLGHLISDKGVEKHPTAIEKICKVPVPKNKKELKCFLGLAGWYRQYVPNFATLTDSLFKLLSGKKKFVWSKEHQSDFDRVKQEMSDQQILAHPNFNKDFILRTDASNVGVGAVLLQKGDEDKEFIITCASKALTSSQRNYTVQEKELFAIIFGLTKFREYLEGYSFILETDNKALTYLQTMRNNNDRLMRWAAYLQQWSPNIKHIKGTDNVIADYLSRNPEIDNEEIKVVEDYMFPPSCLLTLTTDLNLKLIFESQQGDDFVSNLDFTKNKKFKKVDNVVYYLNKVVIPKSLEEEIIKEFHDPSHAGHLGIFKTYHKVKNSVWFPNMFKTVSDYVKHCDKCQRNKYDNKKKPGLMQPSAVSKPGEILYMDVLGPYTRSREGYQYVLVTVDHFTKWVEMFPMKKAASLTIGKILEQEMFCRYGMPKVLVSDNGTNLVSNIMKNLCLEWKIKHRTTSIYHAQSNLTERVNRNIKTMMRIYTENDKHGTWADELPSFRLALNNAIHESTHFSPAELLLNRRLRVPFDNVVNGEEEPDFVGMVDAEIDINMILDRKSKYDEIVKLVESNLQLAGERQKHYYDQRRREDWFNEGDIVVAKSVPRSSAEKRLTASFVDLFEDKPAKIVKKHSDLTYDIIYQDGTVRGPLHIEFLRKYFPKIELSFPNVNQADSDDSEGSIGISMDHSGIDGSSNDLGGGVSESENSLSPNPENSFENFDPNLSYTFNNSTIQPVKSTRFPRLDYRALHAKGTKTSKK